MRLTLNFIFLLVILTSGCSIAQEPGNIDAKEFSRLINEKNGVVIDIRTPEEFSTGHIPGAVNINYYNEDFLQQIVKQFSNDMPLFLYCASANRSTKAMKQMKENNFTQVYNLIKGIPAWKEAGFETE
ncbi:MAG: rhodanese-like domain-containing protein [Bacteroidetes bacterium]|nr:rhodanese-like domain-containing protein [Bacteroidota bacterium]HET6244264.1 rhodanese-like domain-containing protein [Bacteroidia bacterium]